MRRVDRTGRLRSGPTNSVLDLTQEATIEVRTWGEMDGGKYEFERGVV